MSVNRFVGEKFYNGVAVDILTSAIPAKKWGRGARFWMYSHTGKLFVLCFPQGKNTFINVALLDPNEVDISEMPDEPPILPDWAVWKGSIS